MISKDTKKLLNDVYELDSEVYTEEEMELLLNTIINNNKKKVELVEEKLNISDSLDKKES